MDKHLGTPQYPRPHYEDYPSWAGQFESPTTVGFDFPTPEPLPAQLPADSSLLFENYCPVCAVRLVHAHCDSPHCNALWCAPCNRVVNVDVTSYGRVDKLGDDEHEVISA